MLDPKTFRVAALGASAGGLEAFRTLLATLPPDTGMAFLLVQHLDPQHASFMVPLLASHTEMKVSEAGEGTRLEPNRIYVIPPGRYLTVSDGELHLSPVGGGGRARMPFDVLLESLAETYGERAACVVLSGTGSDGSIGAQAMRQKGGLTIAQDPSEAEYDGMPRSAIAAGAIGVVLPLERVAHALLDFARTGIVPGGPAEGTFPANTSYAKIIDLLRQRSAHDFDLHKRGTLMRRIQRRMTLANLDDPARYLELLEQDPDEVRNLIDDLFINVTRFFRDAQAFELMRAKVLPDLLRDLPYNQPFRAWVAGCSTGEEAYSIAMILYEAMSDLGRSIKVTVFASDIDEEAIAFAREGLYPATIEADVSAARLARFFVKEEQGYRVQRNLRDLVVFSVHDLLSDAPFSRMDLVSCVNVLIYLRPEVQQQVLALFHFALVDRGILFLGSSGSIGEAGDHFEAISQKERIYRHVGRSRPGEVELPIGRGELTRALWPRPVRRLLPRRPNLSELAQRVLLQNFAPASVLTNLRNEGIYYFGPIDRYLRVPEGEAGQTILGAAREGLRGALRKAIETTTKTQERAVVGGARVQRNGSTVTVVVTAQPIRSEGEQMLLISFIDEAPSPPPQTQIPAAAAPSVTEASRIEQLERELEDARQQIEDSAHERETAEEELKAVNEEAMSLNEEFQTTNEELQTSKEELQSLNEELTTLNVQLQETVDREHAAADDLHNILSSTDVGTLFLDEALNIRFFTPSARPLFNVIPSDVGRPMADLARNFPDENLIPDARAVLNKFIPISREVAVEDGTMYIRRVLPYRTRENQVKGVVVTYVDVSEVKMAERAAAAARAEAESIVGEIRGPLLVLDSDLRVVAASRSFYQLFQTDASRTLGRTLANVDGGHLDVPELGRFVELIRTDAEAVRDYEMEVELPGIGRRTLIFSAVDIPQDGHGPRKVLLAIDDITGRKQEQAALLAAKREAEAANLSKSRFLFAASHDLRQPVQALSLLQAMLAAKVSGQETRSMTRRMGEALATITGMLDTLLGVSQLEAGVIKPEISAFSIGELMDRLRTEFTPLAETRGLRFRVVPCRLLVQSDPRLFEQMLRNLVDNAVKYTENGGVLLGCRRRGDMLRVEVWDTGIGIAEEHVGRIFQEFHQIGNAARQPGHGVGLGLSIVQRLANLLGHKIDVRSLPGRGSVFTVTVPLAPPQTVPAPTAPPKAESADPDAQVLIVEDDTLLRESLETFLVGEGYRTIAVGDGPRALALVTSAEFRPDIAIVDHNLPGGMSGVELLTKLRETLRRDLPALVLTGDVSTGTVKEIERRGYIHRAKPIGTDELLRVLASLLAAPRA